MSYINPRRFKSGLEGERVGVMWNEDRCLIGTVRGARSAISWGSCELEVELLAPVQEKDLDRMSMSPKLVEKLWVGITQTTLKGA